MSQELYGIRERKFKRMRDKTRITRVMGVWMSKWIDKSRDIERNQGLQWKIQEYNDEQGER